MRFWFVLLVILIGAPAAAAPNLQEVSTINGVKVFRDHEKPNLFYYLKAEKRLVEKEGKPDFRYDVNRYIGNVETEDSDEFWVRGVIRFRTTSTFVNTSHQAIKEQLVARHRVSVDLRAAPIHDSYSRLVYETIRPVENGTNRGEFDGGQMTGVNENGEITTSRRVFATDEQRFAIGLKDLNANFFWENFDRENLILSLVYGWDVKGVIPGEEDDWVESTFSVGNALPIEVSPARYPSLFNKNELWQSVAVAHSNVTVMCYDFINVEETDLYYVIVDLRFLTLGNRRYEEKIKFVANSDVYEIKARFKLVNELERGYEYRVRRLYEDGTYVDLGWRSSNTPFLDISMTVDELEARNTETGVNS